MTQKYPVTVQEMDRIAKTIDLTTGYNDRAMKRTCLLVRLGCEPTAELYQHELSISERHPADVAQDIAPDPRTADQIELDRWQDETTATREADYPL